ncbi:MAG: glycine--tRNA ligase [Dehalococcoidia bacterium]|nr:glycine--tRNA ligase [Dehalococcoidia bacterium]
MEKLVSLCKRRGFIFPSSEIYGGLSSCWDYGPLGVAMKRNIKDAWWHTIVQSRDDVVGIDTSILMHPRVWEASGHLSGFSDPLVECKKCNLRFRADELKEQLCTACGSPLSDPRQFNLMFKTFMGPVEDAAAVVYMRPETAQGIFVNFENVLTSTRKKLPLGIAQQGKSFRNEITTGNLIFRSREFEQMELEFFVKPGTDMEWFDYWVNARMEWYIKLGIKPENLRLRPHPKEDLAHYALCCTDVEYRFPWNWGELEGIANRGDFDLKQHSKYSGKGLSYFDESISATIVPYVIEPSAGVDRSMLAFLADAYDEEPDKDEVRVVLRLNPIIAPVKVAVLPLSKKDTLTPLAQQIYCDLRQSYAAVYDDSQSIGRRYRRQDETGTPYCVTVDFQSLEDQAVTIRERDSMKQERIAITELKAVLSERLAI